MRWVEAVVRAEWWAVKVVITALAAAVVWVVVEPFCAKAWRKK